MEKEQRMDKQTKLIRRIEEICKEFDARVEQFGLEIARLELAKALATAESNQEDE